MAKKRVESLAQDVIEGNGYSYADTPRIAKTSEILAELGLTYNAVSWFAACARNAGAEPMAAALDPILRRLEAERE